MGTGRAGMGGNEPPLWDTWSPRCLWSTPVPSWVSCSGQKRQLELGETHTSQLRPRAGRSVLTGKMKSKRSRGPRRAQYCERAPGGLYCERAPMPRTLQASRSTGLLGLAPLRAGPVTPDDSLSDSVPDFLNARVKIPPDSSRGSFTQEDLGLHIVACHSPNFRELCTLLTQGFWSCIPGD